MRHRILAAALAASTWLTPIGAARAQTVAELQAQINELKALIKAQGAERVGPPLRTRRVGRGDAGTQIAAGRPVLSSVSPPAAHVKTAAEHAAEHPFVLERPETWLDALTPPPPQLLADANAHSARPKTWFERLSLRGYTQLRGNEFLAGDASAPSGVSRLRSVHDGGITENNNFTFRRVRLILQGDIHERLFLYIQPDFASAISNQANGEQRLAYGQLRDAFVDVFLDDERRTKLRFGQQKVPYGWENLQSSQNRLTLDRSDAINSALPGERDIGVTAYYTPWHVQAIWDRLAKGGQKLFGNYGAFGVGIYNGQTLNRIEQNNELMIAGMATWPFALDGLGPLFEGQVLEVGASAYRNDFQPEIRAGGVSPVTFRDDRVGVHAILYPQPFGLQAEYNWGRGPEFDVVTQAIQDKPLQGGYIQAMYKVDSSLIGPFYPYVRLQTYEGGWKVNTNAPRLDTDELEVGIEMQPVKALELTLAYARMKRKEADERRLGRAEGDLFRAQLQWNY